ncbi:MAG: gliding motility-associated C-terminal domain-containing protein, partial [Saprospiraceae bacterium]
CVSSTECVTITGDNTLPVAMASASNDLDCNDLTATLNTTGSDPGTYTGAGPGNPTGANPTVNMPGTYTLTVSSGNGCTSTQEVTITQDNASPTASIMQPSAIDCNNSSVTLDGSGSSSGVTYMWSTGEATATTTTNMGAGTYTLTVTNTSNGCTDEVSVTVDDNSTTVTADVDVQGQITCTSGSVTLSAINVTGSSNPTYTWSNGMNGQTITVATAGSITLTVTDATTGCTGDVVADVTSDNNTPMAVADVSGVLNCNNTSVVLSTAGSTTGGNITASWSAADPNNVTTPGIYTLTITNDDNGCTATADVNVIQDITPPVASIIAPTAIDCNNTNTTLDGSSSTGANLSYAWTGQVGAGATLNATEAGTYTLTVTNMDNGCTDTEEVTVVDNTSTVTVSASVSNDLSCLETSATLDVSGGSGSSNPTYSWFDGTNTTAGPTLTTMNPGTYTLTLIDGTTGCQGSTEVIVDQDTNFPTATVAAPNNLTCITSSITLDGTSSTAGNDITYSWLFNGSPIPGTDPLLSVNNAGNYQIVVTDAANGCEVTSSIIPVILDDSSPVASAVAGNNGIISCSATSLTIDGTASSTNSGNINYSWILNGTEVGTTDTYDVTSPGDYILEITDTDNGCTAQEMITISPDADLPLLSIDPVVNLDCNNSSSTLIGNGSSNAGNTVTVEWQDALGNTVSATDEYTTAVPGDYTFIVIDNGNGCSLSQLVTVLEDTNSPLIDVTPAPIIDCANTSVLVNASNSASGINISYQWQDALGNDLPLETSNTLTTGTAGDYIFVVTNTDNGCTSTQTVTVPENIEAPVFDASALNNIDCNNMEAALTSSITSSFSTDLTYSWVLNGTTIGTMPTLSTANEGVITVLVTDNQNGCSSQMDVTVSNTTQDPTIAAVASSNGALDCITIETTLDGTGSDTGTNFNYSWALDTDPTNTLSTDLMYTTEDPGIYILTVTNTDNGCVSTVPVTVTQSIAPPNSVATSNTATLTCTDPTITLDGTSSSIGANFTYQWFEVVGGISTAITGATDISYDAGVEGTYELVVTNTDNGCTTVSDQLVLNQSSDVPTAVISNDGILTCDNQMVIVDGLSSTAGGILTYEWVDLATGDVLGTDPTLEITTSIEVVLNIEDQNNGCTSTASFLIDEDIEDPSADAGLAQTLLCGDIEVTLDGSASSANGDPITYAWTDPMGNPGGSTATVGASTPGTWTLTITNTDNGCTSTSTVVVDQDTNAPSLSMTPSNSILNCDIQTITFDASASSVAMGSSGTLTYEWTDANGLPLGNTATIDVSTTDEVFVTITDDANGCSVSESFATTQDIEEPSADAGSTQTLTCGSSQVTLDGSNSSANGTITYAWYAPNDPNTVVATTATVDATMSGTWTLLITNTDNGCTSTSEVLVDQDINAPTAVVDFSGMLTCADTELTIDGSNSTIQSPNGTIEYLWENGATTATTTFDAPGTYTVLITDNGNGCTAEQSFTIDQDIIEPIADIQALTSTTISCSEPSLVFNGSASNNNGNPNGGTLTYLWTLNNIPVTGGTTDQVEISEEGELVLEVFNSNNGCSSTFLMNIDVSDDVPQVDIPSAPNSLNCNIDEVTIVATASTGNEFTYLWTGPGTIIGETTLTPTVSTTGIYTLTVTNTINDCDATATALIEGDFDTPNAFANATDQFDCVTDEVTLDGTGSATGPTISYLWTTATGVIESGQNTFNPVVSAPGDYTLLVTDNDNGCTSTAVVTVSANTDVPTIAGVQTINPNCFGENNGSIILDNVTGGQLPYLYSIDGGAFAPINQFSFLGAGQYDIIVQDANGCEASDQITISDPQELLVELGDNQTIGLGDEFQLSAQIVGAYDTIMWSANCPDSLCADQPEFSVSPLNTVSYFVTVVDGNGCITTDQITINVEKGREVFIPNAFNPNGSANPRFWVFAGQEAYKVHEFRVFNRWGEQVFAAFDYDPKSQDDTNGWDGTLDNKKMNPAVFVYYVDIEYIDGRREVLKGDVALRR